ncbi:MAG: hypothetical protein ACK5AZ_25590 [Bryobacteraceae bacterium]
MGVAFTQKPIRVGLINGSSSTPLRLGIHTVLTAAGWAAEEVTGGFKYTLVSPQGLKAKCLIRNLGATSVGMPCLSIQFLWFDEARLGQVHLLGIRAGRVYEVVAGKCQLFISLPGYSSTTPDERWEHAVCGGVPYVPLRECEDERPAQDTQEAWWSSGSFNASSHTFRTAWYHSGTLWSACFDGELTFPAQMDPATARLRLAAVAHPLPDYGIFLSAQKTQWLNEDPLYFDPLLIWGKPVGRLRAQIWDAMLGSKSMPLDHEIETEEFDSETGQHYGRFTWRNWMQFQGDMSKGAGGSYFSSLYLLRSAPVAFGLPSNYVSTERFELADSQDPLQNGGFGGARVRRRFDGQKPNWICTGVYEALKDAGWQEVNGTNASWGLVLPYGVPYTTPPDPPVTPVLVNNGPHAVTIDGIRLVFYDPHRHIPNRFIPDILWIEMGETVVQSLENLEAGITQFQWIPLGKWQQKGGFHDGWWHLDFVAPEYGLAWNAYQFGGGPNISGSSRIWSHIWPAGATSPSGTGPAGGGFYMRSFQAGGWLEVWIGIPTTAPHVATFRFKASMGGESPSRTLPVSDTLYLIIANQFQFLVFLDHAPPNSHAQLFACFPKMAAEHGVHYAAIVAGRASFRQTLQWSGSSAAAANSGFTRTLDVYDYIGSYPGLYMIKFLGSDLLEAKEKPIAQNAYIGAPANGAPRTVDGQSRIVGRMWDALILSKDNPLDERMRFGSLNFQCVTKETAYGANKASLRVAYESIESD